MPEPDEINVNLHLKGELLKKATDLKNNYGLESYTEDSKPIDVHSHSQCHVS